MSGRCFILLGMQKDRERPGMPLPPSCIAQKVWPSRIGQADEDLGRNSQCQRVYQCSSWPGAAEQRVLLRARSRQKGPAGKGKGQMRTGLSCKLSKVFRVYVMTFYALLQVFLGESNTSYKQIINCCNELNLSLITTSSERLRRLNLRPLTFIKLNFHTSVGLNCYWSLRFEALTPNKYEFNKCLKTVMKLWQR